MLSVSLATSTYLDLDPVFPCLLAAVFYKLEPRKMSRLTAHRFFICERAWSHSHATRTLIPAWCFASLTALPTHTNEQTENGIDEPPKDYYRVDLIFFSVLNTFFFFNQSQPKTFEQYSTHYYYKMHKTKRQWNA